MHAGTARQSLSGAARGRVNGWGWEKGTERIFILTDVKRGVHGTYVHRPVRGREGQRLRMRGWPSVHGETDRPWCLFKRAFPSTAARCVDLLAFYFSPRTRRAGARTSRLVVVRKQSKGQRSVTTPQLTPGRKIPGDTRTVGWFAKSQTRFVRTLGS